MQSRFIEKVNTDQKVIALTFDDGPRGVNPIDLLSILAENSIVCTFFLVGKGIEIMPDYASMILHQGHQIANHSYNHFELDSLKQATIKAEIIKTENAMINILGINPKPFFRVPYNKYNETILNIAGSLGYSFTISSSMVAYKHAEEPNEEVIKRVLDYVKPGAIITMDAGMRNYPKEVLVGIINGLKNMGYRLITVSELMALEKNYSHSVVKIGSIGEDVRYIQKLLSQLGYKYMRIDGVFGPLTEAAVKAFQLDEGLVTDGIVENNTWEAIEGKVK